MAKLVDARDLKSLGGNTVPVQVRPRAPSKNMKQVHYLVLVLSVFGIMSAYGSEQSLSLSDVFDTIAQSKKIEKPLSAEISGLRDDSRSSIDELSFNILIEPKKYFDDSTTSKSLGQSDEQKLKSQILAVIEKSENVQVVRTFKSINVIAAVSNLKGISELSKLESTAYIGQDVGGEGGLNEALPQINVDQVYSEYGLTGKDIHIAVLDTGIDADHADLSDSVESQVCFADFCPNGADNAEDDNGHGTHVSGIITSAGVSSSVGVARNTRIHAIKVLDSSNGFSSSSIIIEALDHIINNLPQVNLVNMSLGTFDRFESFCDQQNIYTRAFATAINMLRDRGTLSFVASMNNASSNSISAPACISNAISVGAVWDSNPSSFNGSCFESNPVPDEMACFSNSSVALDILAPGSPIRAARMNGGSVNYSGTSMATPMGVGCAALLMERSNNLTANQIESLLKNSTEVYRSDPLGREFPRIDCLASIEAVPNPAEPLTNLDIDGNSRFDALSDGLILLRLMFGLTGQSLTNGVTAPDANFVYSGDLIQRFNSTDLLLDIDDDKSIDALTDGLLILRYLFGIRGENLSTNALSPSAERTAVSELEEYLQSLINQ